MVGLGNLYDVGGGSKIVKTTITKNCKKSRNTASSVTNSNVFIDAPNMAQISVLAGQIVGYAVSVHKLVAGNIFWRIIGVSSSTVYASGQQIASAEGRTYGTCSIPISENVKMQYRSDDANNASLDGGATTGTCMACGDFALVPAAASTIFYLDALMQYTSLDFCPITSQEVAGAVWSVLSGVKVGDLDALITTISMQSKTLIQRLNYFTNNFLVGTMIICSIQGEFLTY